MAEKTENKRQWKRYTVKNGAVAMAVKPPTLIRKKPTYIKLGPIKDIGMKGLAVQYIENKQALHKVKKLSIMVPGKGMVVEDIPFTVITDFEIGELPKSKKIRNLCVAFHNLLPMQKIQIERFIDENAHTPV